MTALCVKASGRNSAGARALLEHVAAENSCQEMLVKAAEASRAEGFWKHLGFKRYTGSTDVKSLWAKEGLAVATKRPAAGGAGRRGRDPADARTNFEAAMRA